MDSRSIFLTANDNTVYSWMWIDLRNGPLVLEAPAEGARRDQRHVVPLGRRCRLHRAGRGARAESTCCCRPVTRATVPDGYFVVRPPTFSIWVPWRSFLVDGDPKPGVELVKKSTRVYPLAEAANPPPMKFVDVSGKAFNTVAPADYTFWELSEPGRAGGAERVARPGHGSASTRRSASRRASPSRPTRG